MSGQSTVGVVGEGPAVDAILAAGSDTDAEIERIELGAADSVDLMVTTATVGDDRFTAANGRRTDPWIAVELGGLGGRPIEAVDAGVSALAGAGPCYDCLALRVRSTVEEPEANARPAVAKPDARLAGAHAGRLVIDLLGGADRIGSVIELPYASRRLLPVPGCSCDSGRPSDLDIDHETVDLEEAVARAEGAVDPRLGPIESVGEAESFPAPYYLATLCDTSGFSAVRASPQAAGVAADWNPAFMKAIGEALERYSAGVYREYGFTVAPEAELAAAVSPQRFVRPDEGFDEPAREDPIAWVAGENLHTGEAVHLPAERVRFPPPAETLGPAITTGLGLGASGADALVSGLTEVVERDATMLAWYSTFEPLVLAVDDPAFEQLAGRARSEDLSVTPLLVTQDVDVPVVTVAVHRESEWPRFAVGSGASMDPIAAAQGALEEALQNWMELRGMGPERAAEEEPSVARYADLPPEARGLVDRDEVVPAAGVGPTDLPTGAGTLDVLLEEVASSGLEAYAARLTPRDVETLGFEAVRVVIPEAQPLFTGGRFFGDRARRVPRDLGFRPRLDRPPHPYP